MKHYPVIVCGIKAAACVEIHWNTATVSIKISHRKGQKMTAKAYKAPGVKCQWEDDYPTYLAVRFSVNTANFLSAQTCAELCALAVYEVNRSINFNAPQELVTRELLHTLN